jgi:hypothetical protein
MNTETATSHGFKPEGILRGPHDQVTMLRANQEVHSLLEYGHRTFHYRHRGNNNGGEGGRR